MGLTFERFYKLRRNLDAFTARDIQTAGVMLEWIESVGFTSDELLMFSKIAPTLHELERIGYFQSHPLPQTLHAIRELEKRLPKAFRKEARSVRLASTDFGRVKE